MAPALPHFAPQLAPPGSLRLVSSLPGYALASSSFICGGPDMAPALPHFAPQLAPPGSLRLVSSLPGYALAISFSICWTLHSRE